MIEQRSVDEVDRYRRGDRGMRIVGGWNDAGTDEHAQVGFPTVFNRWRKSEHLARSGVQLDAGWILCAVEIRNVISGCVGVGVVAVRGVERQHPLPRQAVFPRRIDIERTAGLGVPTEACSRAVDTDVFYVHVVRQTL